MTRIPCPWCDEDMAIVDVAVASVRCDRCASVVDLAPEPVRRPVAAPVVALPIAA